MKQIAIPVVTSKGYTQIEVAFNADGIPVVTSLNVAEVFGKMHHHVMRDIDALDCSREFRESNFGLSSYKPERAKRSYPMYEMTRDGFTFLAMGFTGERAAQFKEGYIKAFNQMEAELNKRNSVAILPDFTNPVEAARAWADQYEQRLALEARANALTSENFVLATENEIMRPKVTLYDQYMDIDGTVSLTDAAKVLGLGSAQRLGWHLRHVLCWLFKETGKITPKASTLRAGLMVTKVWTNDERGVSGVTGRITAKGMEVLMKEFQVKEEKEVA
jgi:Rha family phage regulatory protein